MHEKYQECIQECLHCMQICNHCYDACLKEDNVMMANCIRLDRECADMCGFAAKAMASNSPFASEICQLCASICEACGNECKRHNAAHCQECADVCFKCAKLCKKMPS
ncbi:four-helix bundle copper-binding protein [Bacillus sp. CLL-7-23]|uniref:Four-helix bundle copper-binding protein n=1 Tax=Bacillus changyiensis TaxID=3004103 RepID=A0ABT4X6N4_9BACI|nr:four-helix bundle copper-binding protein [Bacillus changyiensis]MDA7027946.1 four-helix bundle copper-binding protein [Bacillus changyiensis]